MANGAGMAQVTARAAAARLVLGVLEDRVSLAEQVRRGALDRLAPPARARAQRLALSALRNLSRADGVLKPLMRKVPPAPVRAILRVAVSGGGCSGFQYEITLDAPEDADLVLKGQGQQVVIDPVSLPFLSNAVIDFTDELIGARFVIENPNAASSCGCGLSFSM